MTRSRRILVTDGEQRSALAVVRSLGAAGHHVVVTSRDGGSLAGASRHARAEVAVGDPLEGPGAYAEALKSVVRSRSIDLLLPATEGSMRALLPSFEDDPCRIPCGNLEQFLAISDKGRVLDAAAELGIAVPRQELVGNGDEVTEELLASLPYPVVIKPARSVSSDASGGLVKTSVRYAEDEASLRAVLDRAGGAPFPLLLQQRVVGPGVGVFLLLWEGRLVARFAHRRIREKPPSGGVSVYRESIEVDEALVEKARALVEHFDWPGVAMVEFKLDRETGTPYLMEINPRFWGSLQLAVDAGVDFPRLLVEVASGEDVRGPERYRTGVRSRWWWGDVDQMLTRVRRRSSDLDLPPDAPGTGSVLWDFLHLWRPGDRSEVVRLGDLRPFLRESRLWFRHL